MCDSEIAKCEGGDGEIEERTERIRLERERERERASFMRNQDCDKKTSISHNRYNVLAVVIHTESLSG